MNGTRPTDLRALQKQVRVLKAHAIVSTTLLVVLALAAFVRSPARDAFDEIDVGRINIVEPDGKLDMVIANRARMPDPIVDGKRLKRSGEASPGMLFYNDEGDENGGLAFGGRMRDGQPSASAGLLFDRFHQDQTVGIVYSERNGRYTAGLRVWDRPDTPVSQLYERYQAIQRMTDRAAQARAVEALRDSGLVGVQRVFVGQGAGRVAELVLSDGLGRPRITMQVDSAGTPSLEFLDARGRVTYRLPASAGESR